MYLNEQKRLRIITVFLFLVWSFCWEAMKLIPDTTPAIGMPFAQDRDISFPKYVIIRLNQSSSCPLSYSQDTWMDVWLCSGFPRSRIEGLCHPGCPTSSGQSPVLGYELEEFSSPRAKEDLEEWVTHFLPSAGLCWEWGSTIAYLVMGLLPPEWLLQRNEGINSGELILWGASAWEFGFF